MSLLIEKQETDYRLDSQDPPEGCEAIRREDSKLQVDIDSDSLPSTFFDKLDKLKECYNVTKVVGWKSKSGNWHVEVECEQEFSDEDANFLQLFLGSDPIRELLSHRRIVEGIGIAHVLFKPIASKAFEL